MQPIIPPSTPPQSQDASNPGGVKHDIGKTRWDLFPWEAAKEISDVLTYGAAKYGDRNWERGFRWGRPYAAILRHLTAWFVGEDMDRESGFSHLAHAGCELMFLLTLTKRGAGEDDRPRAHFVVKNLWRAPDSV